MKQDLGYLPLLSAKMAFALLEACESDRLSEDSQEYAIDALRHYNSDWKWLPEPIPGLGHIDAFIFLLSAMWVCQESQFPKITAGELELLPKRLNRFFRRRAKSFQNSLAEDTLPPENEDQQEAQTLQKEKTEKENNPKEKTPKKTKAPPQRPSNLKKPERSSAFFQ